MFILLLLILCKTSAWVKRPFNLLFVKWSCFFWMFLIPVIGSLSQLILGNVKISLWCVLSLPLHVINKLWYNSSKHLLVLAAICCCYCSHFSVKNFNMIIGHLPEICYTSICVSFVRCFAVFHMILTFSYLKTTNFLCPCQVFCYTSISPEWVLKLPFIKWSWCSYFIANSVNVAYF